MPDERAEVSRRTLLKLGGGVVVAGGAAALLIEYSTEPAIATSGLTAEDVQIAAAEGRVQQLTLAPTVTVEWENFPPIQTVRVRFRANGPQSNGTAIDWTASDRDSAAASGTAEFDIDEANLLGKNDGPLDASSFRATQEGKTVQSEVTVSMDVQLVDSNDNTVEQLTPAAQTTYAIEVTNQRSEVTVSGQLNTGGQCIRLNDFPEALWEDAECELRETGSGN